MVAAKWGWGLKDVFAHFGVAALVSILLSNVCYLLWFRRELVALKGGPEEGAAEAPMAVMFQTFRDDVAASVSWFDATTARADAARQRLLERARQVAAGEA